MRAKKFGADISISEDKKLARLIKFGAVTDQVWIQFCHLGLFYLMAFRELIINIASKFKHFKCKFLVLVTLAGD